jgi:hypothetical protein
MSLSLRGMPRMLAVVLAAAMAGACSGDVAGPRASPGPAHMVIVSGDLQTARPGQELPQPLVVRVLDQNGDPVPDQIVNFRVVAGNGSMFAGATETDANGLAQDYWTVGLPLGENNFTGPQRVEVRAVDPTTGEKHVYATFEAFALNPPKILGQSNRPQVADTMFLYMGWQGIFGPGGTYTYVWDAGDDTGTWRRSGEVDYPFFDVGYPINPPRTYWFCYYAKSPSGARSAWQCTYFGSPFR